MQFEDSLSALSFMGFEIKEEPSCIVLSKEFDRILLRFDNRKLYATYIIMTRNGPKTSTREYFLTNCDDLHALIKYEYQDVKDEITREDITRIIEDVKNVFSNNGFEVKDVGGGVVVKINEGYVWVKIKYPICLEVSVVRPSFTTRFKLSFDTIKDLPRILKIILKKEVKIS